MTFPPYLSTSDRNSFAYFTLINRFPGIIRSIAENNSLDADIKSKIENLIRALPESPLELLPETSDANVRINNEIKKNAYRWNNAPFIFIENYLYHLLGEIMNFKKNGKDYFSFKKNADVILNKDRFAGFIERIDELFSKKYEEALRDVLYFNILGNKADLSQLSDLRKGKLKLLIDDTEKAADIFRSAKRIDIVLDNSGEELFFDILLVYFLFSKAKTEKIVLHFKTMPYFVSDAMKADFYFLLKEIAGGEPRSRRDAEEDSINKQGKKFADLIYQYVESGRLLLCDDTYWNDTGDFCDMPPHIRNEIDKSDLVIFKGDLNYRKLIGDRQWDFSARTEEITGYIKKNCLIIRILKSELMTGLKKDEIPDLYNNAWMYNGQYGVIQMLTH